MSDDTNRPGPIPPFDIVSDPRIPYGQYLFVPKGTDPEELDRALAYYQGIDTGIVMPPTPRGVGMDQDDFMAWRAAGAPEEFMVLDYEEPMPEPSPDFLWQARYADAAWDAFQHTDPFPADDHGCSVGNYGLFQMHPWPNRQEPPTDQEMQDYALSELLRELGIE